MHTPSEDLQLLVHRLDRDKDGKLSYLEFKQGLTSQTHYLFGGPLHPK